MADIVERLRARADSAHEYSWAQLNEAADEITRLRTQLALKDNLRDAGDKLANAVSNLKPHLYENGMIGESLYEQACIILWKRLAKYRDEELAESRAQALSPSLTDAK